MDKDNVIDLKDKSKSEEKSDFDDIIRRNKEKEERLKKERKEDNQRVKRSYRLNKNKKK